jgi:iron complex transport system substrate-binding protein
VRIASLLPSATEIVCALGLEDQLVAVTHECDYPASVVGKPVVTASLIEGNGSSSAIDRHIRRLVHAGSSIYRLDADRLQALKPDLILTQELCDVCAVSYPIVEEAAHRLDASTQLVSLEPERLEDVFKHIALVARLAGRPSAAPAIITSLEDRVEAVRRLLSRVAPARVVCLEWLDPIYSCGHWTPELVELAGGLELLGVAGRPARPVARDAVLEADPDALVVIACGFSLSKSLAEVASLAGRAGWDQLRAVRSGRVYVVDGNAFFSRPGPRLVTSVEILAGLLHPDLVPPPPASAAVRWSRPV